MVHNFSNFFFLNLESYSPDQPENFEIHYVRSPFLTWREVEEEKEENPSNPQSKVKGNSQVVLSKFLVLFKVS